MKKSIIGLIAFAFVLTSCGEAKKTEIQPSDTELSFSFDELNGNRTVDAVSGKEYKIDYVFEEANADKIFKAPSDPLLKNGVKGKALYMDGFSTRIRIADYTVPDETLTLSAWIAPRVFENLAEYDASSPAGGHTRLTSVLNQGDLEMGEGFVFGYGRLGLWGIQLALHNRETGEDYVVGYYDPLHALPLYEWSFISASFNGKPVIFPCLTTGNRLTKPSYPNWQTRKLFCQTNRFTWDTIAIRWWNSESTVRCRRV